MRLGTVLNVPSLSMFFIAFFININGKYSDKNMYCEKTKSGNYRVGGWYKDPLTGKKREPLLRFFRSMYWRSGSNC